MSEKESIHRLSVDTQNGELIFSGTLENLAQRLKPKQKRDLLEAARQTKAKHSNSSASSRSSWLKIGEQTFPVDSRIEGNWVTFFFQPAGKGKKNKHNVQRLYTEKYVQKNVDRMVQLQLLSRSGDWQLNLHTGEIQGSVGFRALLGLPEEPAFRFNLEQFKSKVLEEDLALLEQFLENEVQQREAYLEFRMHIEAETRHFALYREWPQSTKQSHLQYYFIQDITAFKATEQQYKQERARAIALLRGSHDAFFSVDEEGRIKEYNRLFKEMTQRFFGVKFRKGQRFFEHLPFPDRRYWEEIHRQTIDHEKFTKTLGLSTSPFDIQLEVRSSSLDTENESKEVVFFIRDISEEVYLNEENKKQQILREIAFDQAKIGYFEWNFQKRKLFFSDNCLKLYGLPEGMESLTLDFFINSIHPEDRRVYEDELRKAMENRSSFRMDLRVQTKTGEEKYVYAAGTIILSYNGMAESFIGVLQDITDRKRSELTAKTNERLLSSVLESTEEAVALLDAEAHLLMANVAYYKKCESLWGIPFQTKELFALDNHFIDQIRPLIEEVPKEKRLAKKDLELSLDGEEYVYEVSAYPVEEEDGSFKGISLFIKDITERIQLNRRVIHLMEQVYEQDLQKTRMQTEQLVRGQEMERSRISRELHDGIGQMLHALKLKMGNENEDKASITDYISEVIGETKRICNDLMPLTLESFGLSKGLKNLIDKANQEHPEVDMAFYTNFEERLDAQREKHIYRIVQELVNNTLKYGKAQYIDLQMNKYEDRLVIMMEDDGVGFDPEAGMNSESGGYGLKNMNFRAKLLNAQLTLDSQVGHGLVATLEVPLHQTGQIAEDNK